MWKMFLLETAASTVRSAATRPSTSHRPSSSREAQTEVGGHGASAGTM